MNPQRLLLVEFYFPDRHSQFRSKNYPFLVGQARCLGVSVEWLCCWAPADRDSRTRYVIDLAEDETSRLVEAMRGFCPTHIMLSEKLSDSVWEAVRRALPGAEVCQLADIEPGEILAWPAGWLPQWLGCGVPEFANRSTYLLDAVEPSYRCTAVNRRAGTPDPPVHVTGGFDCVYRRPVKSNPFFEGLDIPEGVRPFGCSFCVGPRELDYVFETDPVELAVRQCTAALATHQGCIASDAYVISGGLVFGQIGRFFGEILKHPFPPSRFFFGCRMDEFLRRAREIEDVLPALQEAGHSVNVFNMGIENFSPPENERLNKGLSLNQIKAAADAAVRLERAFPSAFRFSRWGGYGLILFTPWTTLDDLEVNLERMRRFPNIDAEGFVLSSKLQILSESAIRLLAERDGLLVRDFDGFHYYDSGCVFRWDQRELPWRFENPEVALLYRIGCRIRPVTDIPEDDQLMADVQEVFRFVAQGGGTPFDLFGYCVEAAKAAPAPVSSEEILERVRARLGIPERGETRVVESLDPDGRGLVGQEPCRAVLRVSEILATLAADSGRPLGGFVPGKVFKKKGPTGYWELVMELRRGTESLVFHLLKNRPSIPAFLATSRFLLRYSEKTPIRDVDMERIAWVVAANMERHGLDFEQHDEAVESEAGSPRPVGEDEIRRIVRQSSDRTG